MKCYVRHVQRSVPSETVTASNDECELAVCAVMEFVAILRTMLLEGRFCLWAQFAAFVNRLWFAVAQNMYCERRQSVITFGLGWSLSDLSLIHI